jgi:predicted dehydrogenase
MRDYLNRKLDERKTQKTPSKKLGVGVIGLHEGKTLLTALERTSLAYAAAGCDLKDEKISAVKKEKPDLFYTDNYDEMLKRDDVNIVAIYTPDSLHGENIIKAFHAGKDVISSKPLVNSMEDAKRILEAGRITGRKLLVGQSTRFFEPFRRQRAAYEKGEFGEIEFLDAHYIHRMDWFYEKSPWAISESDWIYMGMSHPIDLVRWYLGRIKEVHALGFTSALAKKYGYKSYDIYSVNFKSEDGKIARVMGNYGLKEMPSARNAIELVLYGSRNTSLAQYHDMKFRYTKDDGTEICEDPLYELRHYYFNSEIHGMHYGEFANYTDYFADAILNNKKYSPDLEEGVETFCIMEAVRRSVKSGLPVKIEPLMAEAGLLD